MVFRAVFLGPPGAGKGTQSARLVQESGVAHMSTGDMLRQHRADGSSLGKQAERFMDTGKLVPDDLMIAMVRDRLGHLDHSGSWILDGFPRTIAQARALDASLDEPLTHVIYFRVPESALVTRLSDRWTCSKCGAIWNTTSNPTRRAGTCDKCGGGLRQRDDDKPEAVRERLRAYTVQTKPLLDYYAGAGILREVDADRAPDAVFATLTAALADDSATASEFER